MKISKKRLIQIIKEELEDSQRQQDIVKDLAYELEFLIGREPTPEEIDRIRDSVLRGEVPNRGME